jgi:EAL domain-containing protein (putative c-di-GMP-specific phosphodiesterase class I)
VLKIERSFIEGITINNADLDLVTATIAMADSLGFTVVAEGVETKEQKALLNDLKCDCLQGYYFSKPITAKQLIEFSKNYTHSDYQCFI